MIFMKRLLILLWIIFNYVFPVNAQNLEESLAFADKQFEQKNYRLALKEYKRVLFFNTGKNIDYLYRQIASIYFVRHDYLNAAYNYELAYKTARNTEKKIDYIFKKASCYMLDNKFRMATFELMNLPDSSDNAFNARKNFYFAVCYWGLEDFDKAKEHFLAMIPANHPASRDEINTLFAKKKNLYRPNPKTAKIMSMILPGLGQFYSGDVKNGLNSLALTGGLVVLGIYMTEYYSFLDAFLTAAPWFMRYYKGGYQKAEQIARHKRDNRRNRTYKEILKIIAAQK